ncbi:MAG TPA: nucleotidyltransferase family protein [Deinococcales bacterium]|nr:nucleotidyltransferase family protein [Deinococcales bacterium]
MRRDDALRIIGEHAQELRELGVKELYLFGSVARDEAREDSDVDVIVSLHRPLGLAFFTIQDRLEGWLGRKVDLGTVASLKPYLRERVVNEMVRAA